ncbi:MAG: HIT family protein [Xanthomonadales bacterium]|nr:HIT family protein [Xanthomonadales bacterium]
MSNATLEKFGYTTGLIYESEHWVVLLRPQQVTLGALILGAKSDALSYGELPPAAFSEMHGVIHNLEACLARAFQYKKMNYLMLMMVDPHVHYHVLPRFDEAQSFAGVRFEDPGWPGPPRLDAVNAMNDDQFAKLLAHLRDVWQECSC